MKSEILIITSRRNRRTRRNHDSIRVIRNEVAKFNPSNP